MIGTGAAILGASLIGGGLSALSTNSATKSAANSSQAATEASVAAQNAALATQQGNTATARAVGDQALNSLAGRYGLQGTNPAAPATQSAPTVNWAKYVNEQPDVLANWNAMTPEDKAQFGNDIAKFGQFHAAESEKLGQTRDLTPFTAPSAPAPAATDNAPPAPGVNGDGIYTQPRPEITAAPTYTAPTLTAAPKYEAPAFRETAIEPLDVSLDNYEKSPDYEFQLSEGNRNILANASATGGLESGAALKALQKYGQDLALGDYGQWRDYTTGQFNQDRSFAASRDDAYNTASINNAQYGHNALQNQWTFGNNFAQNNALTSYGAQSDAYKFNTNLTQGADESDRNYQTGQYNTNTNALLSLAGIGQGAVNSSNNALSNNATANSNAYLTNGTNQGNAALAGAGQINNLIGNGANALAYVYGNKGAGGTPGATNYGQIPSANALTKPIW